MATNHHSPSREAHDRSNPLLSVDDLRTEIRTERETIRAVDGVSFDLARGETLCLVGESGSGKSITCKSVTGILPDPADIVEGRIEFDGRSLLEADDNQLRAIRGDRIAHVFQNPQRALDPVYTIGDQLVEAIAIHADIPESRARERAIELLQRVGIPRADARIDDYPHEFSGGMCQRAAIAIALASDPEVLIADEPTTAVDVTVQARLIELLRELTDGGMSVLLITHDLRVAAALADRLLVMYGGTIVERGPLADVFAQPAHPYTQALFESYAGLSTQGERTARGNVPTDGCRFRADCPHAIDACVGGEQPPAYAVGAGENHGVSCVHYGPDRDPAAVLADATAMAPVATEGNDD